jgi:bifunctional non-homologous end joining protein LigD
MALELYKKKRNFKKTPEPTAQVNLSAKKLVFCIQRHKASHLHYDLRLEMDGVLKSWAVPKGPSLNPKDKRLAMMVEDHPFDYRKFEGIIPEGNYGAGIVEIWDEGELTDLDDSDRVTSEKNLKRGLKSGNLKFKLKGSKLNGEFALVKIGNRGENAWLLIKHRDEFAVDEEYNSEVQTPENSAINEWLRDHDKEKFLKTQAKNQKTKVKSQKKNAKKVSLKKERRSGKGSSKTNRSNIPKIIKPMLAKETGKAFSDKDWIYEIKWDGYRAIADVNYDTVKLFSRNGNSFNDAYPLVVKGLKDLAIDAVVDGEIIIVDKEGRSNFQLLQYYGSDDNHPIEFRVFDVLFINGKNLCDLPLTERKGKLKDLIGEGNEIIKYSDHIEEKGEEFFNLAMENDLEGIIAKRADSSYLPGARTSEWLKIKYHKSTEAIIAGFTSPTGSRNNFGALILAKYDGKDLKYIGHTGTGFNNRMLSDMAKLLKPLITKTSPFKDKVKSNTPVTWVKPELVAEIKFTEWTKDKKLRHPVFLGLRNDKKAKDITMKKDTSLKKITVKTTAKKAASKKAKTISKEKANTDKEKEYKFGRVRVRVTNPKKIFWPEEGFTKDNVIEYYISVSKYILPFLKGRPESLKRNPNGIKEFGFFHKDAGDTAPDWVKSKKIFSESTDKDIDYILCNNQATLTYLNNLGCIEINPWHSTINKLDHPDYMIIDIDPSDNNTFDQVVETAQVFREIFKKAGTESYCKTSGASGLHVYVPMGKKYTYDQVKDFAELVCMIAQEELPDFTTMIRNLKKRGKDHIYLDYLQNRRGQTISSVYSLRPKEGATVSMPLKWNEVKPGLSPKDFHIKNVLKRIQKNPDLFMPVLGIGVDLKKCLKKLGI